MSRGERLVMSSLTRSSCIKSNKTLPINSQYCLLQNFGISEFYRISYLRLIYENSGSLEFWKFKLPNIQNSSFDNLFFISYSIFDTKKTVNEQSNTDHSVHRF